VPTLLRQDKAIIAAGVVMAGLAIGVGFVRWELRSPAPVVDLRLFRRSEFAASCLSICLSNLVMYTTLLALPLYLERVRGHDSRVTGLTLAALSAVAALAGPIGGRWADGRGIWLPSVVGAIGLALGSAVLAGVISGTQLLPVLLALATMGLGLGIASAPVQAAAMEAAPGRAAGAASGIYSTARYVGSVVGSSVLAMVFATRPARGASDRFMALFAALAVIAILGIAVNARVAARHQAGAAAAG
jgi:MFS family permease